MEHRLYLHGMVNHKNTDPCQCQHCDKEFKNLGCLAYHLHGSPKPCAGPDGKEGVKDKTLSYECPTCKMKFYKEHRLHFHLYLKHKNKDPCKCKNCGKDFKTHGSLAYHLHNARQKCGTVNKTCVCKICEKEFPDKVTRDVHKKKCLSQPSVQCPICGKKLSVLSLPHHIKSHSEEKCFCDICGRSFKRKISLKLHMRLHTGDTHSCDICGKTFMQECRLRIHKRLHTNYRPYKCQYCGKGYAIKHALLFHEKFHKPRPFNCELCGKGFVADHFLQRHMLVHTGEKPFECELCGRAFATKWTLTCHYKTHDDGPKLHKCKFCGKRFAEKGSLKIHVAFHKLQVKEEADKSDIYDSGMVIFKNGVEEMKDIMKSRNIIQENQQQVHVQLVNESSYEIKVNDTDLYNYAISVNEQGAAGSFHDLKIKEEESLQELETANNEEMDNIVKIFF